jgi:NDP-sugar pyrophosphorylase family protein
MNLDDCQIVIFAGGLAKRLGSLTEKVPKSMLEVAGKPFIQHQVELLKSKGIKEILILTGHLAEQIEQFCGDGSAYGVEIKYSREPEPLGTSGALKFAEQHLKPRFLIMYGDAYLPFDYGLLWDRMRRSVRKAVMCIYKNENKFGRSNVVFDLPVVAFFDATPQSEPSSRASQLKPHQKLEYIDYGISAVRREVIEALPSGHKGSMNDVFAELASKRQLDGLEIKERFYEIGSNEGLEEFRNFMSAKV